MRRSSSSARKRAWPDRLALDAGSDHRLSGVGRELSQWVLEHFTERKLLVFDLGGNLRYDRRAEGGCRIANGSARFQEVARALAMIIFWISLVPS